MCTKKKPAAGVCGGFSDSVRRHNTLGPNCINLDEYQGCSYTVWASTPAIVWTAARPQEFGIHVHVHDGNTRVIDDTFSEVTLGGKPLERAALIQSMFQRTII